MLSNRIGVGYIQSYDPAIQRKRERRGGGPDGNSEDKFRKIVRRVQLNNARFRFYFLNLKAARIPDLSLSRNERREKEKKKAAGVIASLIRWTNR